MMTRTYAIRESLLGMLASMLMLTAVHAQPAEKKAEPLRGTLSSTEQKGRNLVLKVEDESGKVTEHLITARTPVAIVSKSDLSMLVPGYFVKAVVNKANEQTLLGESFNVYPALEGRKPTGKVEKAPPTPGLSKNAYFATGTITVVEQDPDYPKYTAVTLAITSRNSARLLVESNAKVEVHLNDIEKAEPGSKVTIHGTPLPRDRFRISSVEIESKEKFEPSDFPPSGR